MNTIDWKSEYINTQNQNITNTAKYFSVAGRVGASGSREDPFQQYQDITNANRHYIVGNGHFTLTIKNLQNGSEYPSIVGSGIGKSIVNLLGGGGPYNLNATDMTITNVTPITQNHLYNQLWKRIYFDNVPPFASQFPHGGMINCIFKTQVTSPPGYYSQSTYIDISTDINYVNGGLMTKCEVKITQEKLNKYNSSYWAFDNCAFIIGLESTPTPLIGLNSDELRANFVERCQAQGLVVPLINDYPEEVHVGRWIFSKTSIAGEYEILKDSEIDKFAKLRGIYFGYSNKTVKQVIITKDAKNIPESITSAFGTHQNVLINNNSIELLAGSSINDGIKAHAESKIIWLGGLQKLTDINISHNLLTLAGVAPTSIYGLATTDTKNIKQGKHYIIRSSGNDLATVNYNNVEYTSSLITRKNVFIGVGDKATFTDISGNSLVYQILSFANHQTLQIRLMRQLPESKITAANGNLQAGYWYFVDPLDLKDTTGSVSYNGTIHPVFDSFLVDEKNLNYINLNNAQLRKCWHKDAEFGNDPDFSSWKGQKPYFFDVVPNDLRCMMKNDSSGSAELAIAEDNEYIGSGHPLFYNKVNGISGLPSPAYDLVGSYLQIRVPITTTNLM